MKSFMSRHAALIVAFAALVLSFTGWAEGAREAVEKQFKASAAQSRKVPKSALPFKVSRKPRKYGVLQLGKNKRFPAKAMPRKVPRARRADRLGRAPAAAFVAQCPDDTVDLGTWCLQSSTFSLDRGDLGRNDYMFAEQKCAARGGYVPSAGQMIGAADSVKLSSTIDDARLTASIDEDGSDGLKDRREMTSTLVTVSSGSSASGSIGVTAGSKGDPKQGEPDPFPVPRDPSPSTLQYVTVFDNRNRGGFAGSKPVSEPEAFRCAFNKRQGDDAREIVG